MSEEHILECPHCPRGKDNKLYVNVDQGVFHCFRCEFKGPIKKLYRYPNIISKLEDLLDLAETARLRMEKPLELSSFELLKSLNPVREVLYGDPHYTYLIDRGWTDALISSYRPLVSANSLYADRVILPIFDASDKLVYFTGRSILSGVKQKYINASVPKSNIVFLSKLVENSLYPKIGVICEGFFDGFKIPNALALLGKMLSHDNEHNVLGFLKNKTDIYVCLDKGAESEMVVICKKLHNWAPSKHIHFINTSAYGDQDLGDLSKTLSSHQLLSFIMGNSTEYVPPTLSSSIKNRFLLVTC